MINFIIKKLKFFYYKKIILSYLFYTILILILSTIFGSKLILKIDYLFDENFNIILSKIPFYYGPLIENIYNGKGYFHNIYGFKSYLDRFPFLPFFVIYISKLSVNIYFFLFVKNFIFFSIFFVCLIIYCRKKNVEYIYFFSILAIIFYNFYNITTLLNFIFSDAFIGILLPSIFLILISENKYKYIIVSFLLFLLFFMKSTMIFVTFSISFLYLIFEKKSGILKRISPLVFFLAASLIWGGFGFLKTGVFPIGSKISSSNQLSLTTTLNKNFHKYYPKNSVDIIPLDNQQKVFNNEWEMYDYYKKKNIKYIKENKKRFLKDTFIKIKFILFNVHKDAVFPDKNGNYSNPFMFSHLMNRIVTIMSLIICIISIYKNSLSFKFQKSDIYYLIIYASSVFPYIVGWATSKHLVGIFLISHIYLILKILSNKFTKNYFSSIF